MLEGGWVIKHYNCSGIHICPLRKQDTKHTEATGKLSVYNYDNCLQIVIEAGLPSNVCLRSADGRGACEMQTTNNSPCVSIYCSISHNWQLLGIVLLKLNEWVDAVCLVMQRLPRSPQLCTIRCTLIDDILERVIILEMLGIQRSIVGIAPGDGMGCLGWEMANSSPSIVMIITTAQTKRYCHKGLICHQCILCCALGHFVLILVNNKPFDIQSAPLVVYMYMY